MINYNMFFSKIQVIYRKQLIIFTLYGNNDTILYRINKKTTGKLASPLGKKNKPIEKIIYNNKTPRVELSVLYGESVIILIL